MEWNDPASFVQVDYKLKTRPTKVTWPFGKFSLIRKWTGVVANGQQHRTNKRAAEVMFPNQQHRRDG